MKKLNRIVELLEAIHYQLQLANWMTAGGKASKRPVDPHADPHIGTTVRNFNGQPVKVLSEQNITYGVHSASVAAQAIVDGIAFKPSNGRSA